MIRTTFAATPRRHEVLAAKAIVLGAVVLAVGLVACLPAYLFGLSLLQANGFDATYGYAAPTFGETVRGVGGTAVYLAALALLGLGIGAILRHTAAAISAVLGLLWVPLMLVWMLPMDVGLKVARFCPMIAGLAIQRTVERSDTVPISPGAGLALFCAYAAAALGGGIWLVARRDA
jgi:ABC-2 type transport system permease protein